MSQAPLNKNACQRMLSTNVNPHHITNQRHIINVSCLCMSRQCRARQNANFRHITTAGRRASVGEGVAACYGECGRVPPASQVGENASQCVAKGVRVAMCVCAAYAKVMPCTSYGCQCVWCVWCGITLLGLQEVSRSDWGRQKWGVCVPKKCVGRQVGKRTYSSQERNLI